LSNNKTEVKLKLKNPIIGHKGTPVKNIDNIQKIAQENPKLTSAEIMEKCDDMLFGDMLPVILLHVPMDNTEKKFKLFRWASKIEDKMVTAKSELILDLNQITELYDFVSKSTGTETNVLIPILIEFERLKEELTKNTK